MLRQKDVNVIRTKWIFKDKMDENGVIVRNKVRLVAQGFKQIEGIDHWVFGPSFPSFLLSYHLSLRYIPRLKTTLRPWDHMSSLTTLTGQVFKIRLIFRYHHDSSFGRCLYDV